MTTTADYRYPGSRPFLDTDLDRKLFFGRDKEKEEFFHLILAEKLVVLFAKSGMGKTSLLNAGILQPLRERRFLPFKIRFNDPKLTPLQTAYAAIKDAIAQQQLDAQPGDETTLWRYFKTAEFWSKNDLLLKPVLILDHRSYVKLFISMIVGMDNVWKVGIFVMSGERSVSTATGSKVPSGCLKTI
jgi:hypothetical protein